MYSFTQAKNAMQNLGYPTSAGDGWQGIDQNSYDNFYVPSVSYAAGVPVDTVKASYGFAYPSEMPPAVAAALVAGGGSGGNTDSYYASVVGYPAIGYAPFTTTFNLSQGGGTATSFLWNFEDSTEGITSQQTTMEHTYQSAGTYYARVTPTVDGTLVGPYTSNTITVQ
jgi:hypothetical protein